MGRLDDYQILVGRAASKMTRRRGMQSSAAQKAEPCDGDSNSTSNDSSSGLLFLGNPHQSVPVALLRDPRLGAVDKIGWQMMRLCTTDDQCTAFPSYDDLQPMLSSGIGKIASRGTVARVVAVLRLTRWLSLCHRARNTLNGRVVGNVYVLHDEPLSPVEGAMLDREYIDLVAKCREHKDRVVREVAGSVYQEMTDAGVWIRPKPLDRLNQRAKRFQEMHGQQGQPSVATGNENTRTEAGVGDTSQFASRTKSRNNNLDLSSRRELSEEQSRTNLSSHSELSLKSNTYRLVRVANSDPTVVRSSNKHTYCTTPPSDERELFWPGNLEFGPGERDDIAMKLGPLPIDMRQAVLDETAGQVAAGKAQNAPGLLHGLVKRALTGQFRPTRYAQSIADRRGERYVAEPPPSAPAGAGASVNTGAVVRSGHEGRTSASVASGNAEGQGKCRLESLSAEGAEARRQMLTMLGLN
ncbi:hypothetical protein SAMN04487953_12263 [Billgrantia desiderata]|nr:hypothetical protein SAMN04487953_12263 [Halomonas desiderata]